MGLPLFCDTPSAKRNKPRTPEQRAAPHPGDVPENVLDELCDGAIRELDHFELGLPAGDEQIAKLLDDKRAELRRLIRTYPDVRRIVETATRAGKERVILVKPRVPVSGHDGSGIDVERVSFTPISAYVFYFVINSTSRLQLAIAESQSKLEKHSMEVHLENRIALGLFGERDGEVTYASYAGMTPSSGSKARGDAHRRGDSGASRLNAATTGARQIFCHVLGNTKQTEKFAALDRALGHLALSAMVRKLYFPGGFYASAYAYALVECGDDADKVRALQKVFWKLVRYKSNVTLVEANKLVADFGPPYQPSSARGVGNRWHAALKDQLVPLDLDLKITGSAGGYQVNAYENALVEMLNRIPGGPAAPARRGRRVARRRLRGDDVLHAAGRVLGDIYAAAARRVDDHARARARGGARDGRLPAAQSLHSTRLARSRRRSSRLVDEGMEPRLPEIRRRLEAIQLSYRSAFVALAPELQRACAVVAADIRDAAVATVDFLASSEF
ncbi:hypothetical protein JL720_4808 [Aureococcus anophagefferens]|nr:hypothetical protein JL720_4808 [Aureococcus anophagefferens]